MTTNDAELRVLLTVEQAAEQLSLGRTTIYDLLKTGQLDSVHVGRLRRIPATALNEFTDQLTQQNYRKKGETNATQKPTGRNPRTQSR